MRTSLILAAAFGLHTYVDCAAQKPSSGFHAEAGLEATYWVVDAGTYSTASQTRWGLDLPVSPTFVLQPQAHLVRPVGSATAGPEGNGVMLRFGLGLAWR